ncbi:MAG: 50S ribosomal protein L6, partial [Bacteroidetes bacterium]|nr:50S ribosomal protein L6 [Bacteroidota bacterium]
MSRIGKLPIAIPDGVQITVSDDNLVTVKSKMGQLEQQIDPKISVRVDGSTVFVERKSEAQDDRAKHGLYRSLVNNMVKGVSEGFKTVQELVGVGYKA